MLLTKPRKRFVLFTAVAYARPLSHSKTVSCTTYLFECADRGRESSLHSFGGINQKRVDLRVISFHVRANSVQLVFDTGRDFIIHTLPNELRFKVFFNLPLLLVKVVKYAFVFLSALTPATAFEGKTARGNLGWWWLRVRGRHGP
jgi:hypothetical protein